jgi:hypothetical protein
MTKNWEFLKMGKFQDKGKKIFERMLLLLSDAYKLAS